MTPAEAIPILTGIRRLYAGSRYPTFDEKVAALDCAIRELTHIVTFEEATMSDCGPGSRDDPRLRPCKVRIYDTDEGPVLEHSTVTQWDWDCMEFLLAEARYFNERQVPLPGHLTNRAVGRSNITQDEHDTSDGEEADG